jgi:hypothetical protein
MADEWRHRATAMADPAFRYSAVTPHDSNNLAIDARAIWVGTRGNVVCVSTDGDVATFLNVEGLLPVSARRINATGTTASNIVALW